MILFFAFQTPEFSLDLSEAVRLWPEQIGAGTTAVVYVMVKKIMRHLLNETGFLKGNDIYCGLHYVLRHTDPAGEVHTVP